MKLGMKDIDLSSKAAGALVSLGFLIIVFMAFMGYRYFEVYTVFLEILPIGDSLADPDRINASRFIAISVVSGTIIFMVHAQSFPAWKIAKGDQKDEFRHIYWSKLFLFLVSLIINALFWKVWEYDSPQQQFQKWFVSIMIALMDYGFAHLFDVLRKRSVLKEATKELEEKYNKLKEAVKEELTKLKEARREQKRIEEDALKKYCPKCETQFVNIQAKNRHICKPK